MILDIILASIILVWAIFGYRRGFVRQIFVLIGIALVVFVSAPMADMIEQILIEEFNIPLAGRYMRGILLSLSGSLLYIISFLVGRFLQETLVKGISLAEKTNHILGMTLAILQASLLIYFILCIGSVYAHKVEKYAPVIHQTMTESCLYMAADQVNLLENYAFFKKTSELPTSNDLQDAQNKDFKPVEQTQTDTGVSDSDASPASTTVPSGSQAQPKRTIKRVPAN